MSFFTYSRVHDYSDDDDDECHTNPAAFPESAELGTKAEPFSSARENLIDVEGDSLHGTSIGARSLSNLNISDNCSTAMERAASSPAGVRHERLLKPIVDMEEERAVTEQRELIIYAIPFTRDELVFLPVVPWQEAPPTYSGLSGQVQEKLANIQASALETWQKMKEKEPGTIGNKMYQLGQRVVESSTPEERLMRNIPKNITKVIIHHPSQIMPDIIMEKLTSLSSAYSNQSVGKAAVAGMILPIAFGIDILIIPGPQVLTYYTLWHLYKNSVSATGSNRLTKYIAQEGKENSIRVNYVPNPRLDKYLEIVADSVDGVLDEADIESLVHDIRERELQTPLMELRTRHLRMNVAHKQEYAQVPSSDIGAPSEANGKEKGSSGPWWKKG